MENKIAEVKFWCVNDGKQHTVPLGATLGEISTQWCSKVRDQKTGKTYPVLAALVDNKLKELSYKLVNPSKVEFIGITDADGRRCYIRSLGFVLQKVVRDLYPDNVLILDHNLPNGAYYEIHELSVDEDGKQDVHSIKDSDLERIKEEMLKIIDRDLPFTKEKMLSEDAIEIFKSNHQPLKAELLASLGKFSASVYSLGGITDTFYGPLVPSTGYLKVFSIMRYADGFCLQSPKINDPETVSAPINQDKIASTLKTYSRWCETIGINGVGTLNKIIQEGKAIDLINISEALHEKEYARIADEIYKKRHDVKVVLIAGPSSSGKTSSSLRLALQLKVLGMNPKVIELDNYFVDRELTPKLENGDYDFEHLHAMNLDLLNQQINDMLAGKEVELPKFDFKEGKSLPSGIRMSLKENDILMMEGIHALNPEMTSAVDDSRIFRVYASALTSLNLDENNNISTSDNRLLRRIIRDNRVRGITPEETILRWHNVRMGEVRNIFPFQENADAIFNSALLFELPMLKYFAMPLLLRILPSSPAYTEAVRLIKFLGYMTPLQPSEIDAIPPTSIMREFIGGQTLSHTGL